MSTFGVRVGRFVYEDVVIDGQIYRVPWAVAAHIKFLEASALRLAERLEQLSDQSRAA